MASHLLLLQPQLLLGKFLDLLGGLGQQALEVGRQGANLEEWVRCRRRRSGERSWGHTSCTGAQDSEDARLEEDPLLDNKGLSCPCP